MFDHLLTFVLFVYSILVVRYLLFAGLAFLLCYVLLKGILSHRKIQRALPKRSDYWREIGYSLSTFAIFVGMALLVFSEPLRPYTKFIVGSPEATWSFWSSFLLSVVGMIVIHDAYFYWTHRLMHWKPLYKRMHQTHHRSTNPSPWAAFAFHPLEAVVEAGVLFVFAFVFPIHVLALAVFVLWMNLFNILGHLGYELFPKWLTRSPLGCFLNTSTNHNMHHQYFRGNYGLYFNWWDRMMGTTHPKYEETLHLMQNGNGRRAESR